MADDSGKHFSELVAPLLLGFTLGTSVALATNPPAHLAWQSWPLGCFLAASGFLLASVQLSAGSLYRAGGSGFLRFLSTNLGLLAFGLGLVLLAWPSPVPGFAEVKSLAGWEGAKVVGLWIMAFLVLSSFVARIVLSAVPTLWRWHKVGNRGHPPQRPVPTAERGQPGRS